MEYRIQVEIRIGPGIRSELAPTTEGDAFKAFVKALGKIMDDTPIGQDVTASSGLSTVQLTLMDLKTNEIESTRIDEDLTTLFEKYDLVASLKQSPPGQN